jgi:hypothetical protein
MKLEGSNELNGGQDRHVSHVTPQQNRLNNKLSAV